MAEEYHGRHPDKPSKPLEPETPEVRDASLLEPDEPQAIGEPPVGAYGTHDGRFGEEFDDELNMPGILWVAVGVLVTTVLGFALSWWIYQWRVEAEDEAAPAPTPVVQREIVERGEAPRLPAGPLLQASPEAELREMRRELGARLNGYGWTDEAQGLVHVPIDVAIDRAVAEGLPEAEPAAETPPAETPPADATPAAEGEPSP